jgi:hypothetical protein
MALYLYRNPKTNEIREIVQPMNAEHRYFDDDGLEWAREFVSPQAKIDTRIDPMNKHDFCDKTRKKNYNLGETMDISAELSKKREKMEGVDKVRESAMQRYERKTGKSHPERPKKTKWVI